MGENARPTRRDSSGHRRNGCPLRRHRQRHPRRHAGESDRHIHLRLRRCSCNQEGQRHPWHLRHREGRHPTRLFRHRGGPVGCWRYFQMVDRIRLRGRRRPLREPGQGGYHPPTRRQRSAGAGLEQWQPHGSGRSDAQRSAFGNHAAHHQGGNLPRAHRGHGIRRTNDH